MIWTSKEKQLLTDLYPSCSDKELCQFLHKTKGQIRGMKSRMGLNTKHVVTDLAGQRFGFLVVIEKAFSKNSKVYWKCECENCGCELVVDGYLLRHNHPLSHCDCTKIDQSGNASVQFKHGDSKTKLYNIWTAMRGRVSNPKQWNFQYYGARGIKVCPEWSNYEVFKSWALNNGYVEGLSIDRIDTNGNYEPSNCRWITMQEQQANRRICKEVINSEKKQICKPVRYGT